MGKIMISGWGMLEKSNKDLQKYQVGKYLKIKKKDCGGASNGLQESL